MKKPFAKDWIHVSSDVIYSQELHRWYDQKKQILYDEVSANHNGITGTGAALKRIIQKHNGRENHGNHSST